MFHQMEMFLGAGKSIKAWLTIFTNGWVFTDCVHYKNDRSGLLRILMTSTTTIRVKSRKIIAVEIKEFMREE